MSGKAIHFACVWSCLAHGGWRWSVPQRVNWWRGENLQGGKSSVLYLPVLFEGDVSWQCRRGLKINVAKGGSDSLSAGCGSLGWPDWSWMSLLLLNLVYVNQADSEGLGGCPLGSNRRDGLRRMQECHSFNFQQLISFYFVQVEKKKTLKCSILFWFFVQLCCAACCTFITDFTVVVWIKIFI